MKRILLWVVTVMIFQLLVIWMTILWNGNHTFWFSIVATLIHDNFTSFRIWFDRFFGGEVPVNE